MSNNKEWLKKIPQHALDYIGNSKIEEIQCIISDTSGIVRGKALPSGTFAKSSEIYLPESLFNQTITGQFAEIERPCKCEVEYLDYNGKKEILKAEGLLATCIQHEMDHLEGILFIDYLSKLKKTMIVKNPEKVNLVFSKILLKLMVMLLLLVYMIKPHDLLYHLLADQASGRKTNL